ncbi:hypothetical protein BD626DRAFT_119094 [Schizophyllum amplum]|uniref:ER transporter 6TM N-terminal domain-containing protein n=1 Tax=Schizophyllum amplum TaxID=97359 RepID=A0A550CV13_9AGAR|nr:hypothetical protein BD626DRAFT_119094 [Auriculariopsis ampla]
MSHDALPNGSLHRSSRPSNLTLRIASQNGKPQSTRMPSSPNRSSPLPQFAEKDTSPTRRLWKLNLPQSLPKPLQWIPQRFTYSNIKPVVRCALSGWILLVLFLIHPVASTMGQASFIVLIGSFLAPPSGPFIATLEHEVLIVLHACVAWAWCCLGIKLAYLTRQERIPYVPFTEAISGKYIEAAPTVIIAVFIFVASSVFLYIKARQGPGPYVFPTVFACLCVDTTMTLAVFMPYPAYSVGSYVVLPLAIKAAVALLCSVFIFPLTVSAQFTTALQAVIRPMTTALDLHQAALATSPDDEDFASTVAKLAATVSGAENALVPLAASGRLLSSDLIFCRFAPDDFRAFQEFFRRLVVRSHGMVIYFSLINPVRERFPITPVTSRVVTPRTETPSSTRPPSPDRKASHDDLPFSSRTSSGPSSRPISMLTATGRQHSHRNRHRHHHGHSLARHLHQSLHHLAMTRPHKTEPTVGVFESYRYLNLDARHYPERDYENYAAQSTALLKDCCDPLIVKCREAVAWIPLWLQGVRAHRFHLWGGKAAREKARQDSLDEVTRLRTELDNVLEEFRAQGRLAVLDLYRPFFDRDMEDPHLADMPPHRHLFHSYVYQYHLMQVAGILIETLDAIKQLETKRTDCRVWTPARRILRWNVWEFSSTIDEEDDEDPDVVQGLAPSVEEDLGLAIRRDPDVLPPSNGFEWAMNHIYKVFVALGGGNSIFAVKAGALSIILCMPSFLSNSAEFAYTNSFNWAIFIGQLTLMRFRGDTTFGLVSRVFTTLFGGLLGTIVWYISSGSLDSGNPYGLAAVCGVCFPFFFYARLHWPGPPISSAIFFVTAMLVMAYSYRNTWSSLPGSPGFGIDIAWRRFVLVTCGVFAAFIFSFLPPSTTIRRLQRRTLATTCSEIGAIFCSIVSFANVPQDVDTQEILTSLIAIRSKLKRSITRSQNVTYEFSLRGKWPAERYNKIRELQIQLAYSLSHLMSVIKHMDPAWTRAFLRRTRLVDSDFQGDVLAVISLISTALRTGTPLPQITPCPLLDRFMLHFHGLNVIHKESEEDYGLPRTLTLETLENEQYLMFCVGVSTTFRIITRLDRLMVAAKEIVGEQYHIHGVGLDGGHRFAPAPLGLRPSRDV